MIHVALIFRIDYVPNNLNFVQGSMAPVVSMLAIDGNL